MADDQLTVAKRFMEGLSRLDLDSMLAEVSDDVVLELPYAPPGLPKVVRGKEEFARFMGTAIESVAMTAPGFGGQSKLVVPKDGTAERPLPSHIWPSFVPPEQVPPFVPSLKTWNSADEATPVSLSPARVSFAWNRKSLTHRLSENDLRASPRSVDAGAATGSGSDASSLRGGSGRIAEGSKTIQP